ncbi:hypothetical protein [Halorubrum lacusprofundi]|nr:hypothetical protein [Halorubrum lacusprofundi]
MIDRESSPAVADEYIERLFRDSRTNALLGWAVVGVLLVAFAESALDADLQWMVFIGVVSVIVLVPAIAYRSWEVMLPWELIGLATFPILVRGVIGGTVGTFATYLALAGLALVVVVELHMFTELNVTHWFAVVLGGCHRKRHTRRRRMLELCLRAPASCKRRLLSTSSSM